MVGSIYKTKTRTTSPVLVPFCLVLDIRHGTWILRLQSNLWSTINRSPEEERGSASYILSLDHASFEMASTSLLGGRNIGHTAPAGLI